MKKIEFYPGINLDKAYQELQENAPCYGEFNEKTLYSTESLDEVFVKVTGKSKAEHDEYIRKIHEEYDRKEAEFKSKIPQLTEDYRKRARGIIPEEHLKYWDEIVPIRLNDLYHGMELDCWLAFIEILNDTSKKELERFERCRSLFSNQGHSGMSAGLVFSGLKRFHPLGEMLVSYIKDPIDVHPIKASSGINDKMYILEYSEVQNVLHYNLNPENVNANGYVALGSHTWNECVSFSDYLKTEFGYLSKRLSLLQVKEAYLKFINKSNN